MNNIPIKFNYTNEKNMSKYPIKPPNFIKIIQTKPLLYQKNIDIIITKKKTDGLFFGLLLLK